MAAHSVPGLSFHADMVSVEEEAALLAEINAAAWDATALSRRTQNYGYRYPYSRGKIEELDVATPIPEFFRPLLERVGALTGVAFNQVIVNEYKPGQGISPHVDHTGVFGDTVVSCSLGSAAVMLMQNRAGDVKVEVPLPRRSAVVLRGDARYKWKHSIPARMADHSVPRGTRVSITFRTTGDALTSERK